MCLFKSGAAPLYHSLVTGLLHIIQLTQKGHPRMVVANAYWREGTKATSNSVASGQMTSCTNRLNKHTCKYASVL